MSSTILMAIVLVVMWLVVLVPMFVTPRRRAGRDPVDGPVRHRDAGAVPPLAGHRRGRRPPAGTRRSRPTPYADGASPIRAAARGPRCIRRRRRTLAVLAVHRRAGAAPARWSSAAGCGWCQASPTLLLVGYVGWLRQQVRREQARRDRRAALFAEPAGRRPQPRAATARPAARLDRAGCPTAAPVDRRRGRRGPADPTGRWRPVPVPPRRTSPRRSTAAAPETVGRAWTTTTSSFADLDPLGDAASSGHAVAVNE